MAIFWCSHQRGHRRRELAMQGRSTISRDCMLSGEAKYSHGLCEDDDCCCVCHEPLHDCLQETAVGKVFARSRWTARSYEARRQRRFAIPTYSDLVDFVARARRGGPGSLAATEGPVGHCSARGRVDSCMTTYFPATSGLGIPAENILGERRSRGTLVTEWSQKFAHYRGQL